jgi:hypothetical protein
MKRASILVLVILVLLLFVSQVVHASIWCKYARFNPGFATICFWEMMMDAWAIDDYFDEGTTDDSD